MKYCASMSQSLRVFDQRCSWCVDDARGWRWCRRGAIMVVGDPPWGKNDGFSNFWGKIEQGGAKKKPGNQGHFNCRNSFVGELYTSGQLCVECRGHDKKLKIIKSRNSLHFATKLDFCWSDKTTPFFVLLYIIAVVHVRRRRFWSSRVVTLKAVWIRNYISAKENTTIKIQNSK